MHCPTLLTTPLLFLLLPSLISAAPGADWKSNYCLPSATASAMVDAFASVLINPALTASVAGSLLADSFMESSDSINFLGGFPLGDVTFPSKGAFIGGQGAQPAIGFTVLSVDSTCGGAVAFRWVASVGSMVDEVKGINVFYAENTGLGGFGGWQIAQSYSEFNTGAWVLDIGGTCAVPSTA